MVHHRRDRSITPVDDVEMNKDRSDESLSNENDDVHDEDSTPRVDGDPNTTTATPGYRRRDEVGEVRKMSSQDTNRLRWWRVIVTGVLLLTALAITFTTYVLLKQQEDENFQTAVRCWWFEGSF